MVGVRQKNPKFGVRSAVSKNSLAPNEKQLVFLLKILQKEEKKHIYLIFKKPSQPRNWKKVSIFNALVVVREKTLIAAFLHPISHQRQSCEITAVVLIP